MTSSQVNEYGEDFENTKNGFIDFLLLDQDGYPLIVLEAKRSDKNPLDGKEQARKYAKSLNVRYIILSNGNMHYFWDMEICNPTIITKFPTPESIKSHSKFQTNPSSLVN